MIDFAWTAMISLGAIVAAVLLAALLANHPSIVAIITAIHIAVAWEFPVLPPIASVAGTTIYFLDILSVILIIISLRRLSYALSNRGVAALGTVIWVVIIVILLASLLRGAQEFGLPAAANEFRAFLYVFAVLQWSLTLEWTPELSRRIFWTGSLVLGWVLLGVFAVHTSMYGLGSASDFVISSTGIAQTGRPLVAGQALVLLLCALVTIIRWVQSRNLLLLVSSIAFLGGVLLTQHRSVWAAALAGILAIAISAGARVRIRLLAVGLTGILAMTVFIALGVFGPVADILLESYSNTGTYDARQTSWTALIDQTLQSGDPARILFGSPMGTGYGRFEGEGRWVEFAPHNWYVSVFLRTGLVGLFALVILLLAILAISIKRRSVISAGVVAILLVFGWAYSWPWYAGLFLGWAISAGQEHRDESSGEPGQPSTYRRLAWHGPAARWRSSSHTDLYPKGDHHGIA